MTSCLSEDAVISLIDGKTAGPTRRANEAHLSTCTDCRDKVSARVHTRGGAHDALAHAATVLSPAGRPSPPVAPGEIIGGKYEVEWPIGSGGMGVVVAAIHQVLGHRVAIKFPLPEVRRTSDGHERLLREARACASLRSEYTVRLLDVGALADGSPYVVMEYLVGRTLAERIMENGPLPLADAVDGLVQACEALEEAHARGIVHRDLKPSNLFETNRFDGSRVVKVLDFGIAKAPPFRGEGPLTITRDVMGSPAYMAPEQLRSTRDVDARADIWALGVTLRELLTGKVDDAVVTPAGVDRIVRRCLELDPARRFPSTRELAAALAPFGSDVAVGIAARLGVVRTERTVSRSASWGVAVALLIAAGAGSFAWLQLHPRPSAATATIAATALAVTTSTPTSIPTPTPTPTPIPAPPTTPAAFLRLHASSTSVRPPPPPPAASHSPTPPPPAPNDPPDPHGLLDRK